MSRPAGCKCGHSRAIHEHHRSGTDCAHQACQCHRFRRPMYERVWGWWDAAADEYRTHRMISQLMKEMDEQ